MTKQLKANQIVDEIFNLYNQHGNLDYIGEPVSQLEHMAQSAEMAKNAGYDEEVILAAFFHDIGHLCSNAKQPDMNGYGTMDHEELGAKFLEERGFSARVVFLVKGHVAAKRYLTYKFPDYLTKLSEASRATLSFQGGVMTKQEAEAFEINPDANVMLKMRTWDDNAKIINIEVKNLDELKALALKHLTHQISK
jgi:phosphonate degradation associated HDIG domain protein